MIAEETEKIGFRVTQTERREIEAAVEEGDYQDVSSFIREAVREKLDPEYGMKRFIKNLKRALKENPEVRRELQDALKGI
jgi:Arc/MetJ-type ribon-helix-helix transcriptional regulator